jgi:hypothetical protein
MGSIILSSLTYTEKYFQDMLISNVCFKGSYPDLYKPRIIILMKGDYEVI